MISTKDLDYNQTFTLHRADPLSLPWAHLIAQINVDISMDK